ncbi:hypothetical protein [Xanthomonas dyei]|uniref:hypothetical protein n=1 Tax=Xanthomonas dyei TaxID=743699 RepID=UPI001EE7C21F|nr:hypothetical protein [Xanthomonas dyei]
MAIRQRARQQTQPQPSIDTHLIVRHTSETRSRAQPLALGTRRAVKRKTFKDHRDCQLRRSRRFYRELVQTASRFTAERAARFDKTGIKSDTTLKQNSIHVVNPDIAIVNPNFFDRWRSIVATR